jgi:uncharacterized protein
MKSLADEMVRVIVIEHGVDGFLRDISDPYWFQAFGCVLGFDWHSSGLTTVVTGVLKDVVTPERHGLAVAGGKGKASRGALADIEEASLKMSLSTSKLNELQYASRMCAKVDTSAIQAGYPIYHHAFFVSEHGKWAVVQQGLDVKDGTARRYHWLSDHVESFVVEPHDGIVGETFRPRVLNMTAKEAEENRKSCVDLVKENPNSLISSICVLGSKPTLDRWTEIEPRLRVKQFPAYEMPSRLNWKVFSELYDVQPRNYENMLAFKGVGPSTVRALALVSQLIYGKPASWKDPVKFSFAHGGKDGVPFPVDRKGMEATTKFIREMVESTELNRVSKLNALKRLGRVAESWGL